MPRTKSAFDVGADDVRSAAHSPLARNQSDTSLDARSTDSGGSSSQSFDSKLPSRPAPVPVARPTSQIPAVGVDDQDSWVSLPPPSARPPSLPQEFGQEPPPLPSSRPVGIPSAQPPENPPVAAPRRDIKPDSSMNAGAAVVPRRPVSSLPGAVPTPLIPEMFIGSEKHPSDGAGLVSQLSVDRDTGPTMGLDDGDGPHSQPVIPSRPPVVPARPPVGAVPPAIPARSSILLGQAPPQIPPRQGAGS